MKYTNILSGFFKYTYFDALTFIKAHVNILIIYLYNIIHLYNYMHVYIDKKIYIIIFYL